MKKRISAQLILFLIVTVCLTIFMGFIDYNKEPMELYQVSLNGEIIGLIESKEALEEYIDKEQTELKERYNTKVYAPHGLPARGSP